MQFEYGFMSRTPGQIVATLIRRVLFSVTAFVVGYAFELSRGLFWGWAVLTFLLVVGALLPDPGRIVVRPRYVLQNNDVIIYVAQAESVNVTADELNLVTADTRLTVQRTEFPSNARKAEKIRRHQTTKYNKAADAILRAVRQHAPKANIVDEREAEG